MSSVHGLAEATLERENPVDKKKRAAEIVDTEALDDSVEGHAVNFRPLDTGPNLRRDDDARVARKVRSH